MHPKTTPAQPVAAATPAPGSTASASKPVASMSKASNKLLLILVGNEVETVKVERSKLRIFEGWWATQEVKDVLTFTMDFNKKSDHKFEPAKEYIQTFKLFLYMMHNRETVLQPLPVRKIWQLAHLNRTLGLNADFVIWLARCMADFIGGIVGKDLDVPAGVCEKALVACVLFGWQDFYREIATRLAFHCGTATDPSGKTMLIKPDGEQLLVGVCGEVAYANIIAARAEIMARVIKEAEDGIGAWINRVVIAKCPACHGLRVGALVTAMVEVGLYPKKTPQDVTRSFRQICDGLQENEGMSPTVKQFANMCDQCDGPVPTSSLFPIEDVLHNIDFNRLQEVRDLIVVPALDQV